MRHGQACTSNFLRAFMFLSSLHFLVASCHRATISLQETSTTQLPTPISKSVATEAARVGIDSSTSWSDYLAEKISKRQDIYVAASPLSVAAVCNDGIALVSLHFSDYPNLGRGTVTDLSSNEKIHSKNDALSHFCDLPITLRGPLRIEPIYESNNDLQWPPPMSLITAGWRTDGMALADAARELVMEEVRSYCLPPFVLDSAAATDLVECVEEITCDAKEDTSAQGRLQSNKAPEILRLEGNQAPEMLHNRENTHVVVKRDKKSDDDAIRQQPYYGRRISEGLSYYLTKCVRSLSCIGLLACGSGRRTKGGSLYFIDAMGSHRVRAHAIGNGSSALHRRMGFIDFQKMDCREGLRVLLHLIAEESELVSIPPPRASILSGECEILLDKHGAGSVKSSHNGTFGSKPIISNPAFLGKSHNLQLGETRQSKSFAQGRQWKLASNIVTELAVLKSGEGKMRRIRLSSLFPTTNS